jgi:hypothetical protein
MQHVQIVTRCELALGCILFTHTAARLSPFTRVLKTFTRTMDFLVGGAQIISKEIILGHKKSIPCLLFPA